MSILQLHLPRLAQHPTLNVAKLIMKNVCFVSYSCLPKLQLRKLSNICSRPNNKRKELTKNKNKTKCDISTGSRPKKNKAIYEIDTIRYCNCFGIYIDNASTDRQWVICRCKSWVHEDFIVSDDVADDTCKVYSLCYIDVVCMQQKYVKLFSYLILYNLYVCFLAVERCRIRQKITFGRNMYMLTCAHVRYLRVCVCVYFKLAGVNTCSILRSCHKCADYNTLLIKLKFTMTTPDEKLDSLLKSVAEIQKAHAESRQDLKSRLRRTSSCPSWRPPRKRLKKRNGNGHSSLRRKVMRNNTTSIKISVIVSLPPPNS